jgi:hydrogenase expression/formation protein HypC
VNGKRKKDITRSIIYHLSLIISIVCLAIPGQIKEITGELDEVFRTGKISFGGIIKEVNLSMVPEARIGDYVMVHVGVAISVVDEEEAKKTYDLLMEMGELNELEPGED